MLLTLTRVVLRKCNPSLPLHHSIAGNTGTDAEKRKVKRNKVLFHSMLIPFEIARPVVPRWQMQS